MSIKVRATKLSFNPYVLLQALHFVCIYYILLFHEDQTAGCSAQSELFFRLLLKNTVRWVHTPAYPIFWIAPHRGPLTELKIGSEI
jgi:hypothetical protein